MGGEHRDLADEQFAEGARSGLKGFTLHIKAQEQQLFRDLRRFLHDNDIPIDLSQRVTRFLQHAYRLHTSQSVDSEAERFEKRQIKAHSGGDFFLIVEVAECRVAAWSLA